MRRLNCVVILAILCCTCCFLQSDARIFFYGKHKVPSPPLLVNHVWAEYTQRRCLNIWTELEKELGKCGLCLLVKALRADIESKAVHLQQRRSHEIFSTLPTFAQEVSLSCLCKLSQDFCKHDTCSSHGRLFFQQSHGHKRSLAEKSPKASNPSSDGTSDDSIIIPPELLFQPPPPPPAPVQSSDTITPEEKHKQDLNIVIAIAASIVGIVVFAILIYCCVTRGSRSCSDRQRDDKPLLTLSSSDYSAGSPRSTDNKYFGRHTAPNGSSLNPEGCHGISLPGIPEEGLGLGSGLGPGPGGNSEASTSKSTPGQSNTPPPPPAAPAPPPPKPKAPPPPPKGVRPPPPPKGVGKGPRKPTSGDDPGDDARRTKLKPFFWDKVVGNPEHSMVWDEIRAGSFQFNEEMIESLFGYNPDDRRNNSRGGRPSDPSQPQYIQIIDPKKSQNLAILLKALNVTTEEVRDALLEGNELPPELLQTLLRMAPTQEEELKLRLFTGDLAQLGPAERFLKVLVDIPFAFKRMESLLFMMTFKEEVTNIKESFVTLEVACDELKKSRLFLKLLEAVLKTGNRMNDGTYRGGAQAFKLDTLLKLADVKGTDGKTTLLHFVVQEIVRAEGMKALRAAKENRSVSSMKSDDSFVEDSTYDPTDQYRTLGLQVVSRISSELENVKKAAVVDLDGLTSTVFKLGQSLTKIKSFVKSETENSTEETGFHLALVSFVEHSEDEVKWLIDEEQRISDLVRKTADYFHGNSGREEGLRLFVIVRDFLLMLDRICAQLKTSFAKAARSTPAETSQKSSQEPPQSITDMRQRLFPAISDRRVDETSSGSDSE